MIEVVDDLKDQVPGNSPSGLKVDDYAGNYVIVEIAKGRYAFYAHMAPGSVVVREGEAVRPGQLLGRLGNSGNTDAPHLHFQIMDSPSVLNTKGLPFRFGRMAYQGQLVGSLDAVVDAIFTGKKATLDVRGAGARQLQMPLTLDVIGFE